MPTDNPQVPETPQTPAQPAVTPPTEGENPTEKRIKALSGKVESASKERDEALLQKEAAEKRAAFAEHFVDIMGQYPAARDFKAQIQEKVMAGLTPSDATFAVLGAAGKLGGTPAPMTPMAGGSAPNAINMPATKAVTDMNREDLKNALLEAQRKGDLFLS